MKRIGASCKRWIDVGALTAMGTAVGFLLSSMLSGVAASVARFFADWSRTTIPLLLVILITPLMVVPLHLRGVALGHGRGWWRWVTSRGHPPALLQYPPTWIAVLLAAIALWLLAHLMHPAKPALGYPIAVWGCAMCVLLAASMWALLGGEWLFVEDAETKPDSTNAVTPSTSETTLPKFRDDPAELIRWVGREEPIETPGLDLFDVRWRAERLARRLLEAPPQALSIVGPRGIGKTSLLKLVQHHLTRTSSATSSTVDSVTEPRQPIWISWVDAWGLKNGPSAAEYILSRVIEELSKHVDCIALAGLPAHYRAALSEGGSAWAKMAGTLFSRPQSPFDLLRRLDLILEAVGGRLLIFIEDLDRNMGDEGLFRQVEATLDRLRQLDHVTFVLAFSQVESAETLSSVIDFTRLCDRTEVLPNLDGWKTWQVMEAFRKHCLSCFAGGPDGDIDPALPESRQALDSQDKTRWMFAGGTQPWTFVPKQLAALSATPRLLKQALRRTWQAWQDLHGEIDFDDLLVCNVLRAVNPPAYDYLLTSIGRIRDLEPSDLEGDKSEKVEGERQTLLATLGAGGRHPETLIFSLFPIWSDHAVPRRPAVPQGVSISEPTDYWARANAEAIGPGVRDQEVLRAIRDGKPFGPGRSALVGRLMTDGAFGEKFEQFASRPLADCVNLEADQIRALAGDLFSEVLKRFGAAAGADSTPGYFALWRSLLRKRSGDQELWLTDEIYKALPVSLRFTTDLFYYWGDARSTLLDPAGHARVQEAMIEAARQMFEVNPKRLVSVLHSSHPASVFRLVYSADESKTVQAVQNWLGATLLAAAEIDAGTVIPQIGYLLSEDSRQVAREPDGLTRKVETRFRLSDERLALFYPDLRQRRGLLEQMAGDHEMGNVDDATRRMVAMIRDDARGRLKSMVLAVREQQ